MIQKRRKEKDDVSDEITRVSILTLPLGKRENKMDGGETSTRKDIKGDQAIKSQNVLLIKMDQISLE